MENLGKTYTISAEKCISWENRTGSWDAKCRMCRTTRTFGTGEQAREWMDAHQFDPACDERVNKVITILGNQKELDKMDTPIEPSERQRLVNLEAQMAMLQKQMTIVLRLSMHLDDHEIAILRAIVKAVDESRREGGASYGGEIGLPTIEAFYSILSMTIARVPLK